MSWFSPQGNASHGAAPVQPPTLVDPVSARHRHAAEPLQLHDSAAGVQADHTPISTCTHAIVSTSGGLLRTKTTWAETARLPAPKTLAEGPARRDPAGTEALGTRHAVARRHGRAAPPEAKAWREQEVQRSRIIVPSRDVASPDRSGSPVVQQAARQARTVPPALLPSAALDESNPRPVRAAAGHRVRGTEGACRGGDRPRPPTGSRPRPSPTAPCSSPRAS